MDKRPELRRNATMVFRPFHVDATRELWSISSASDIEATGYKLRIVRQVFDGRWKSG